jgi:hypothetical protein
VIFDDDVNQVPAVMVAAAGAYNYSTAKVRGILFLSAQKF